MIKEVVYKAAQRLKIETVLVANSPIHTPKIGLISSILVPKGADVADAYIVDEVSIEDLVITADIPLADLIVTKGATAINPRGELYTESNIKERLSMRNFMTGMREGGMSTGGPRPLGPQDKKRFASSFDRIMTKLTKRKHP